MRKEYKNGYFEGELDSEGRRVKGVFYKNNGNRYEGEWKDGKAVN